jgi:uncharacterized protein with NRDE domain
MCLALIAFALHPRYRIVIAANRDEYHARPAAPAAWWDEGFLAGRDLKEGGTWLGIDRRGRFALLTNVRDPSRHDANAPTRGNLVPRFLLDRAPPPVALASLVAGGARHNGFNLVAGNASELHWGSNRAASPAGLAPGIHGLSNHLLDTPWPKVERTKAALARWCREGVDADDLAPVFALLRDTRQAPDEALPSTGIPRERERLLSSPFIVSATYGTRCTTVVTVGHDGVVRLVERSFDPSGEANGDVDYRFALEEPRDGA